MAGVPLPLWPCCFVFCCANSTLDVLLPLTSSLFTEHVNVDLDNLHFVPAPHKIYASKELEPVDPNDPTTLGTYYVGYRLEITSDVRELKKHSAITSKEDATVVIHPQVLPFKCQVWLREGNIVARVPANSWEDHGNDNYLLCTKHKDQPWFS